jgi:hypothetical protein
MIVTRLDWWIGLLIVAAVLALHAAVPRYEWRHPGLGYAGNVASGAYYSDGLQWPGSAWIRIDRWTGRAVVVAVPIEAKR